MPFILLKEPLPSAGITSPSSRSGRMPSPLRALPTLPSRLNAPPLLWSFPKVPLPPLKATTMTLASKSNAPAAAALQAALVHLETAGAVTVAANLGRHPVAPTATATVIAQRAATITSWTRTSVLQRQQRQQQQQQQQLPQPPPSAAQRRQ